MALSNFQSSNGGVAAPSYIGKPHWLYFIINVVCTIYIHLTSLSTFWKKSWINLFIFMAMSCRYFFYKQLLGLLTHVAILTYAGNIGLLV